MLKFLRFFLMVSISALFPLSYPAAAHDQWSNGRPVADWVKEKCCGEGWMHNVPPDYVEIRSDGFHLRDDEGHSWVIPMEKATPSQDKDYWISVNPNDAKDFRCFFAPINGA